MFIYYVILKLSVMGVFYVNTTKSLAVDHHMIIFTCKYDSLHSSILVLLRILYINNKII